MTWHLTITWHTDDLLSEHIYLLPDYNVLRDVVQIYI